MLTDSSLLPQMAAGQVDEDIFQAGLSCGEVQKLRAVFFDRIEQRWNGQVRLAHVRQTRPLSWRTDSTPRQQLATHRGQHRCGVPLASNSTTWCPPRRSISSDGVPSAMIWP